MYTKYNIIEVIWQLYTTHLSPIFFLLRYTIFFYEQSKQQEKIASNSYLLKYQILFISHEVTIICSKSTHYFILYHAILQELP